MGKAPCCEKMGLRRGKWTSEEDEMLIKYIQANGEGSWKSLAKNAGLLRCGKSCRLRWVNYLRKDLKRGNFTQEEEELIFKLHRSLGNRWSAIARRLPGRTDNEIKNYWTTHLSRKTYMFYRTKCDSSKFTIETHDMNNQIKKKPGRVSRHFAKKYKHHREFGDPVMHMGKLDSKTIGNNSNYANENMKEIHICPNEMKMTEIEELGSKNDEPMDLNFLLEGDTIDLDGILWDYNEDQNENNLTEVAFDNFKMNASHVYDQEDKNIRSNSSQLVGFCFDEDLVSDWEMGLGFEGINICDNVDDHDDMFLWEWD